MTSSKSKNLKIGFLTTNRADLGIQAPIIRKLSAMSDQAEVHLLLACSQLGMEGSDSIREFDLNFLSSIIQLEGTEVTEDDWASAVGLIGTMGRTTFEAIQHAALDKLVILGDRYEVLGAAYAGALSSVELVHIHGGEVTEGAVDEYIRHAISKMSNTHLVTTCKSGSRLVKMGENPRSIHVVGPLGAESLSLQPLLSRKELERCLGFSLSTTNVLLAFHPETLSEDYGVANLEQVLKVIGQIKACSVLITGSNNDPGSERVTALIRDFSQRHADHVKFIHNLGALLFANVLRHFDLFVGNSSSGLLEAPAFPIRVVNVGTRQGGRESIGPVRNATGDYESLRFAVLDALDDVKSSGNHYDFSKQGEAPSDRAVEVLLADTLTDKTKVFFDHPLD